jgi:hypothetical protein
LDLIASTGASKTGGQRQVSDFAVFQAVKARRLRRGADPICAALRVEQGHRAGSRGEQPGLLSLLGDNNAQDHKKIILIRSLV